jgi:hypothetical protein
MRSARFSVLFLALLGPSVAASLTSVAVVSAGPRTQNDSPIRARRDVPDDPLAGLPSDDSRRPSRPSKGGKARGAKARATCLVDGKPANHRDIGDLRATLAVVARGPRYLPCPDGPASAAIGLRVTVDGDGKITGAEPVGGAPRVSEAVARRLVGKSIAARREGSTTGTVWLAFTPGKGR